MAALKCRPFMAVVMMMLMIGGGGQMMAGVEADNTPAPFSEYFFAGWRPDHVWLSDAGQTINLKLDNTSGCGFESYNSYLRGYVTMSVKVVPGYSAGVVAAYYMTSERTSTTIAWDEIDFEFLGNVTGQPWILQTNLFANGTGGREKRINLWFDPTASYHSYSILWNSQQIVWFVDAIPIRVYRNTPRTIATYPSFRPMTIYSSLWDGDSWATDGGLVKIDWNFAPFISSYTNFFIDACVWNEPNPAPSCYWYTKPYWWDQPSEWTLSIQQRNDYTFYVNKYTVYDYCVDYHRYPTPMPECFDSPW